MLIQAGRQIERDYLQLYPKGLEGKRAAFGSAALDSRGPFLKLFEVWRL